MKDFIFARFCWRRATATVNAARADHRQWPGRTALVLVVLAVTVGGAAAQTCPQIAGYVETVRAGDAGITMEAKLDTGADTSALDARDITTFFRDEATWATFMTGAGEQARRLAGPIVRWVRIHRAGTKAERRPVIALALCVGGQRMSAEFTLTDRSGQAYPVLVGRAALAGRIAVDSSREHVGPLCPAPTP